MNFVLWLIIGGILGWIASLIMGTDEQQGVFLNIVVGVIGALLAGFLLTPLFGIGTNPSCHLLKSMGFCLTLTVKSPISPQEESAHGRQNYRDVLSV